jgi:hypothetical protein
MPRTELYIGNLNKEVCKKDIETVFDKYGRMLRCEIKSKGYGTYAFLEFEEERDAEVITNLLIFKTSFFFINIFECFFNKTMEDIPNI